MAIRSEIASSRNLGLIVLIATIGCKPAEPPIETVTPPDLEVVSAGNEPRQVLRYHAAKDVHTRLELRVAVTLKADEMGGPMPTIVLAIDSEVDAVMPTGQMMMRATIVDVIAVEPGDSTVAVAALQGPLANLKGLAITGVLAPNGRLTGAALDRGTKTIPADMETQVQSLVASFESIMMPLPDDAVGAGAVWRNSRAIAQNGMALKAVNSVTLVAIRGDVIEYALDTDIHGDDQSVTQDGTAIGVKDIVGNGGGKGTIDLGKLVVTSELEAELRAEMSAPDEPKPTKMGMTTTMHVRPL